MRVYKYVVIDIETGNKKVDESYEYEGPIAEAKGPEAPKPSYSASGRLLLGPLRGSLVPALKRDIINDPFQNEASRQYRDTISQIRGSYGARGLAGSGIAIEGEQQAIGDIQAKAQAQRAGQLVNILGTGSNTPSQGQAQQGSGFLGLK